MKKPKLLEPIYIRGMELENRIAYPPMMTNLVAPDGSVTEKLLRFYSKIAQSGVGMILVETAAVIDIPQMRQPLCLSISGDRYISGLTQLADIIHAYGVKAGIQISHPGLAAAYFGGEIVAPSTKPGVPGENVGRPGEVILARELSTEEVEGLVQSFAAAAFRAKTAGFDFIEIHSAHALLHGEFLSPFYNFRKDKYGGDWEGRLRFLIETIESIRKLVGDYPIFVRISADELLGKQGITIEDSVNIIAPRLEKAGVDCIDVSAGSIIHSLTGILIPMYYPRGCWIQYAEAIKKAVNIPVIGVGRINDMRLAEKYVEEGKADIIFLGRQLWADPETIRKYYEGREDEIRMCIGCLENCPRRGTGRMLCAINFDLGRENWFPIKPVEDAKKILIIGGGPAGMEAARIAALRGFKVTLLEKSNELGGQVLAASATPLKGELRNIVNYLKNQLNKLGVDVKMGFEATPEAVKELRPDIVIVATGSKPIIPRVAQGKPNVFTQEEVLTGKVKIGNNVAVWGGEIGCETAISLAEEGKKVTIIDEGTLIERFGIPLPPIRRTWVLSKLLELYSDEKLNVLAETAIRDITSEGILLESRDGKKQVLAVDSIVVAKGRVPNRKLVEELRKDFKNVHEIGDCVKPRNIPAAIEDANYVVRCRI